MVYSIWIWPIQSLASSQNTFFDYHEIIFSFHFTFHLSISQICPSQIPSLTLLFIHNPLELRAQSSILGSPSPLYLIRASAYICLCAMVISFSFKDWNFIYMLMTPKFQISDLTSPLKSELHSQLHTSSIGSWKLLL